MFQDVSLSSQKRGVSLQNIQYELLNSYIKYSSEKLALKEAELLTQTELFLNKYIDIANLNDKKSLNDCCTTEASIQYFCPSEKQSTNRSKGSTLFQRKTKFTPHKNTKGAIADAIQQIKQVCSERTIFTTEHLVAEYQRMSEEQNFSDYRDSHVKRKKERCSVCDYKDSQLLLRTREFQEKIAYLNSQIHRLVTKCKDQDEALASIKKQSEETDKQRKGMFNVCKEYLNEKEASLSDKISQLRLIEREIGRGLRQVVQTEGCRRCEVVRSVRGQILQYRSYYQGEFMKLQRWYKKCRKQMVI